MKLEIERLRLNLSASERDKALLSIDIDPSSINPNLLIDDIYMLKLCRVVSNLAILGQTSMEDKIIGSIGLETSKDNNIIDFWNIIGIGESCQGGMCKVLAETQGSAQSDVNSCFFTCHQCGREACKMCCAGKGALLIRSQSLRRSNSGLNRGYSSDVSGNQCHTSEEILCKQCCSDIVLHALILDYIRVLLSSRRTWRMIKAMEEALELVVGFPIIDRVAQGSKTHDLRKLLNGEESLAEFPFASFLHSVDTDVNAANPLSLLSPLDSGPNDAYWKATTNSTSVDFTIVLGNLSDVSGVILVVSPCGYSVSDAPSVQIWASTKICKEERSSMGKWDVQSLLSSSKELYGPENHRVKELPRHLKFSFKNSVRCRVIWITLTLERIPSLDERESCLHAKRILVVGSSVRYNETELTSKDSSNSNYLNLRHNLESPPRLSRFKIPIESERLIDNDLVLEMYISPTSSNLLAGFRLDSFSAIQPRVTHSPGFNAERDSSFSLLDQRHINPAVLYIRVSILQDPMHKMVTITEYRLPEAKPGTAMYFDFPKGLQTQRIMFRLLGDIAAFIDDPTEQDDTEFRSSPIPVGLSLSNRIKLYYYADSYEVGKWAASA